MEMEEMIENGPKSNSDFQRIFNNLYVGLENNKEKKSNPLCLHVGALWIACIRKCRGTVSPPQESQ
jgi:hypothetical protein